MKRVTLATLALIACALLAAPAFAGPKDIPADVVPKETVTLQVYDQLANYSGIQAGWFADVMLKKFNVKLNIISQPAGSGVLQTRMASGSLGDLVIWGNDQEEYVNGYKAGMLFNWDDEKLLDSYGPYIKASMPFALEKNRKISGGKLYGFGYDVSSSSKDRQEFFYTWDLRWDLYEQLGKPKIKNLDDLVTVLEKMKKICPKDDKGSPTYGVSLFNDWDGNMVMFVKSTATAYNGFDEFDFGLYDPSKQQYHDALENNGPYLTSLKFYNKLYQKGLLDPDSQTQKYNGMSEDFQNGTAFFNIFNWMGSGTYNTEARLKAGKGMFTVAPEQATPICYGQSVYGGNRIWSIGAGSDHPELCMAIINWLSTPEGFLTMQWGPRGVTWDYDKKGKTYLTEPASSPPRIRARPCPPPTPALSRTARTSSTTRPGSTPRSTPSPRNPTSGASGRATRKRRNPTSRTAGAHGPRPPPPMNTWATASSSSPPAPCSARTRSPRPSRSSGTRSPTASRTTAGRPSTPRPIRNTTRSWPT